LVVCSEPSIHLVRVLTLCPGELDVGPNGGRTNHTQQCKINTHFLAQGWHRPRYAGSILTLLLRVWTDLGKMVAERNVMGTASRVSKSNSLKHVRYVSDVYM
jgi:hypothetical protein